MILPLHPRTPACVGVVVVPASLSTTMADDYEGILWTKLSTPLYISKLCG